MKTRPHYAWVICAACTLMIFCNMGVASNSMSLYLPYIVKAHGYTGAQSSAILTVKNVTAFICTPLLVNFYQKTTLRKGGCLTYLSGFLAYLIFSRASSLPMFYAGAAFAGIAYGLGTMAAISLLLERWFHRRKGFAVGLAAAGSGVSSFLMPPLVTLVAERFSLSASFFLTGCICLGLGILWFLMVRDTPAQMGLDPYGEDGPKEQTIRVHPEESLPKSRLMLCCFGMFLMGGVGIAGPGHYAILFTTNGCTPEQIAVATSVSGVAMMISKFVYGDVCDRIGGKRGTTLFMAVLTVGYLVGSQIRFGLQVPMMFAMVLLCAVGFPPATVGASIWATDFSTGAQFPHTLKWFQTCYTLGGLVFSILPGLIYDWVGSYNAAFLLFGIFVAAGLCIVRSAYKVMARQNAG